MQDQKGLIKIDNQGKLPPDKGASLDALVDRSIESQDVSKPSKDTYCRQLKQFVSWLMETGKIEALNSLERKESLFIRNTSSELANPLARWTAT